jgi:uncharacterized RDD family membrane protein YckC
MRLAPRASRLMAQTLDALVALLPLLLVALLSMAFDGGESDVFSVIVILSLGFLIGYYLFADAMPGGQSLGKQMLGLAVIDERSHRPCSVAQSFVRNLPAPILGALDWVFIFGSRRQRLGDKIARTLVIQRGSIYDEIDRM